MIVLSDIALAYGDQVVLDQASLQVVAGECIGLLGKSGSGKSTLLRVIAGEQMPLAGGVTVGDWVPAGKERRPPPGLLGVVYQNPIASLDWLWHVGQCVEEPLIALGLRDRAERQRRARQELQRVRLGHVPLTTRVVTLSIGQAQRVAMARALVCSPRVILADEPTSALDPTTAASIVRLLAEAAAHGAAVITVSHNGPLLASFCSRFARLEAGRLVEISASDASA